MAFDSFYDDLLWSAGFIGGCIINRTAFLDTRYKDFIGTYYAHVAGISLASKGQAIGLVSEPQVGNRVGDASTFTWSSESFGVFQGWRKLLAMLRPTFGEQHHASAYRTHKEAHGYLGWKFLITKRADGLLNWRHVRQLLQDETSSSERLRALIAFALVPKWLAKMAYGAYGRLRRPTLAPFSLE
jgi:abequosyltransferase